MAASTTTQQLNRQELMTQIGLYLANIGKDYLLSKIQDKIEKHLGRTLIFKPEDVLRAITGTNVGVVKSITEFVCVGLFYYGNQLVNPTKNPFDPETQTEDYVKYVLYTWATNDPKTGPAIVYEYVDLKALGQTLR